MSFLHNPRLLFAGRAIQLGFAIGALVIIAWCNTHPGPWINITGPVALGVIASLLTIVLTVHGVFSHIRRDPFEKHHGKAYTIIRVVIDFILFLFWIGTVALMIRPQEWTTDPNLQPGYGGSLPPTVPWAIGEVFAFIEIVSFVATAVLVFIQNRGSRSSPSAGTSAAYV